jgi:hypothetical protein
VAWDIAARLAPAPAAGNSAMTGRHIASVAMR